MYVLGAGRRYPIIVYALFCSPHMIMSGKCSSFLGGLSALWPSPTQSLEYTIKGTFEDEPSPTGGSLNEWEP